MVQNYQERSFRELADLICRVYGERNALYWRGNEHVLKVGTALLALCKAIRKKAPEDEIVTRLAVCIARTITLAYSLRCLDVMLDSIWRKYPEGNCSYCGKKPCECRPDQRPEHSKSTASSEHANWSVTRLCQHGDEMYGEINLEHGLEFNLNRMFEEYMEVMLGLTSSEPVKQGMSLSEHKEILGDELGDLIMRLVAIANFQSLGSRIEERMYDLYRICWRCHQSPCDCGQVNVPRFERPDNPQANSVPGE